MTDAKFKPGQVWTYKTRPGDEGSTVSIYKIENYGKTGEIVHVRIDGLHIHNGRGDEVPTIQHMPFMREAFEQSVLKLVRENQPPNAEDGYQNWLSACGGAYSIPLSKVVEIIQAQLGGGQPANSRL